MATLFIDGFDKYGTTGAASGVTQEWTSMNGATVIAPLSATGYALNFAPNNGAYSINKTLPGNYSRLIGGFRFKTNLASTFGVVFVDSATNQCSISFNMDGTISVRTGYLNGTILGSGATISASTIHYIEWDITFGASAAYQLWLDGVSIVSGTGATKQSGNSYANTISIQVVPFGAMNYTIDDFYLFDTTGSTNTAVLNTNPRIETRRPSSDVQAQWATGTNNYSKVSINPLTGDASSITAASVGSEDLYGFPALTTSSTNVYTVALKGNARKTDTGLKTLDMRLKSGSTDSAGSASGFGPSTTYQWFDTYFDKDPNGNITWTYISADFAVAGPKIAS